MAIVGAIEPILDLLQQPALLCTDRRIEFVNSAAHRLLLRQDMDLELLLKDRLQDLLSRTGSVSFEVRWGQLDYQLSASDCADKTLILLSPIERQSISMTALHQVTASLRASLSSAIAAADSLFPYLEEQEDPIVQAGTASINRSLYRLVRGLTLAGDCCALELGDLHLAPDRTELCNFFADLAETARGFCEENGIRLHLQLPDQTFEGNIDRQLIERAVYNLICNAIAHTPAGGAITLRLKHKDNRAMVCVTDTGEGIAPDLLGVIANRAEHPGPNAEGLGFGLRLVRAVAEKHGGCLVIHSSPAGGARICFSFNLQRSPDETLVLSPSERYDYSGGLDHAHVEFAGVMDDEDYDSRCI